MSGLCGVVRFDGGEVTLAEIEALARRLETRGPDGTRLWRAGQVALGHTLLATTREAELEALPLTDAATGCTITADARLDNRAELIGALGLSAAEQSIGDGELILRAYLEWGEASPARLLGDFAFAIHDPRSNSLFCARDQIGMRQLTYLHDAERRFVFATEPNAIALQADVDCRLNHDRVADFLGNMEGADLVSTFFDNIFRLPPAHSLKVDRHGLVLTRYWTLEPQPLLKLGSDDEYASAFLAVFKEAVRCRLRSNAPVGLMLSGGLDSNAVVAIASDLLGNRRVPELATISAIGPDPSDCPETRAILAAIAASRVPATTICHSQLGSVRNELVRDTAGSAEPFDANMALIRAVYETARRAGHKVVLDGVSSDVLLSSNFHSAFLLRRAKVTSAWREEMGARAFWAAGEGLWRGLASAAWQAFAPQPVRALRFWSGRRTADSTFIKKTAAAAPFLDRARALTRRRQVQRRDLENDRIDRLTHYRALIHPNSVVARERYDRVAAASSIEPRDPFLDVRLLQFCLSLPRNQRQRDGWPKWILRRAIEPFLPAEVIWRRGKEHLGAAFSRAIFHGIARDRCAATALEKSQGAVATASKTLHAPVNSEEITDCAESIYLLNWFDFMRRQGWKSGPRDAERI